jgi:hypothetical protein
LVDSSKSRAFSTDNATRSATALIKSI